MRKRSDIRMSVLALLALVGVSCVPAPKSFRDPGMAPRLIAVLPLANYTVSRDAPDHIAPMLVSELGMHPGIQIVDAGRVEAVLEQEPWLLLDRIPPDLVDRFGKELGTGALIVGSLLAYGYREVGGERIPQVSLSLRLVETPGGRVLWSAVHSRDGADGEWLFGMGRVQSAEQLATRAVHEILSTFPPVNAAASPGEVLPAPAADSSRTAEIAASAPIPSARSAPTAPLASPTPPDSTVQTRAGSDSTVAGTSSTIPASQGTPAGSQPQVVAPAVVQPDDLAPAPSGETEPEKPAAADPRQAQTGSGDDLRADAPVSGVVEDASPQVPAAPQERAAATSSGRFIVRAGVYREPAAARQELSRLRDAAMQATLEHPGRVYMVIVQRCSTRDEARQWVQRALQAGVRCTIDEE